MGARAAKRTRARMRESTTDPWSGRRPAAAAATRCGQGSRKGSPQEDLSAATATDTGASAQESNTRAARRASSAPSVACWRDPSVVARRHRVCSLRLGPAEESSEFDRPVALQVRVGRQAERSRLEERGEDLVPVLLWSRNIRSRKSWVGSRRRFICLRVLQRVAWMPVAKTPAEIMTKVRGSRLLRI